jgi:hypothetical protein
MNVEIFALCDAATDHAGKLNILGTFDSIMSGKLPTVHPHCAVALRMRFSRIESGEHRIRISLVDEDGHAILPNMDASVNIKFGPTGQSLAANLVLNINNLKIEKAGQYSIDLAVDGRLERSLPLLVNLIEKPHAEKPPAPPDMI